MDIEIKPIDRIVGEAEMPGDKSVSHRAAMIGAISEGATTARNFLLGEDCLHTLEAFKKMGVATGVQGTDMKVKGVGLRGLKKPDTELYLGNSGTTMRLMAGILAGQDFEVVLTGDESLTSRPMKRVIEPLRRMGADISSVRQNGAAPLRIKGGKLKAIEFKTEIASAQVKSCVLLAGLYADGETVVEEPMQSRDHTERMLKHFGADIKQAGRVTRIKSGSPLKGKTIRIPGDISSAAFFIALALLLEGSKLKVRSLGVNPTRRKIIEVLKRMGADIRVSAEKKDFEPTADMEIRASELRSATVSAEEVPLLIDEIPILSVIAARAKGTTEVSGVQELRVKETDRIISMVNNLRKMGVDISAKGNDLFITGSSRRFSGSLELESYKDHRTAMAMCVAAAASNAASTIHDVDCINTSFPGFFDIFNYLRR